MGIRSLPFFKGKKGYQFAGMGFSTDSSGGGGGSSGITYSTTEFETNETWVDGKKIYCRVLVGSDFSIDNSIHQLSTSSLQGFDKIVKAVCFNDRKTNTYLDYGINGDWISFTYHPDIYLGTNDERYAIVYYTKRTT